MSSIDLWSLAPELWLVGLGVILLLMDLVTPQGRKYLVGIVGAVGLLLSILPAVGLQGEPRSILFGSYVVDGFAVFFKVVIAIATALVILASIAYFNPPSHFEGEFYALLVFMAVGLELMAASADLILLVLSIEFVSLISYVLAGYLKTNPKSNEAGVKYFLFGAAASAVMLFGFSLLYGLSGTTNIYELAIRFRSATPATLYVGVAMMLTGFGFKISIVPFHQWTPDVYEGAPTPVAAFLSVGSKAAAFAALVRTLLVAIDPTRVDWVLLLAILAAISMTLGNLLALPQRNIKRMLAYSSIAHAGFLLIGVVAYRGNFGLPGLLIYLFGYTFTQLGAFFVVVLVGRQLGSDAIPDYAGLARRAPVSAFLMAVFMLSLIGIPPTAVFLGKFYLLAAAVDNHFVWLAIVALINSALSVVYYMGVIRAMYVLPTTTTTALVEPASLEVALGVAGVGTLLVGLYPQPIIDLARSAGLLLGF